MTVNFSRTWMLMPAATIFGMGAMTAPAFAAGPIVTFPSTITVGQPFTFTVSGIPSGASYIFGGLAGEDNQPQGYAFGYTSINTGQSSATVTATIPQTMTFGSTSVTTEGGPREVSLFAGSHRIYSGVVNLTGVPSDRQRDAQSPYHLTYNPTTGKATISPIPTQAIWVQVYYRSKGQPEQDNYILRGQAVSGHASSVTLDLAGIPGDPGYLEAEFLTNNGPSIDTNELPVTQGIPVGQLPETPWAAALPFVGLGTVVTVLWKRRHGQMV